MTALQMPIVISSTGVTDTLAYGLIVDATVLMAQNITSVTINWWWNKTDATQPIPLTPFKVDTVAIPQASLNTANPTFMAALQAQVDGGTLKTPLDALGASLYILVTQLPAYSTAILAA